MPSLLCAATPSDSTEPATSERNNKPTWHRCRDSLAATEIFAPDPLDIPVVGVRVHDTSSACESLSWRECHSIGAVAKHASQQRRQTPRQEAPVITKHHPPAQ